MYILAGHFWHRNQVAVLKGHVVVTAPCSMLLTHPDLTALSLRFNANPSLLIIAPLSITEPSRWLFRALICSTLGMTVRLLARSPLVRT
jgi:hypothetical protein